MNTTGVWSFLNTYESLGRNEDEEVIDDVECEEMYDSDENKKCCIRSMGK